MSGLTKFRGVNFTSAGVVARSTMSGIPNITVSLLTQGRSWASVRKKIGKAKDAYTSFLPIKTAKFNDVKYLLGRVTLPIGTTFYESITHSQTAKDSEDLEKESRKRLSKKKRIVC